LALGVALIAAAPAFAQTFPPPAPAVPPAQTIQNNPHDSPPVTRTSPPSAAELPKLAGTWSIVSGERNGQRLPDERVAGLRVTITADTITVFDRGNKPFFVVRYKLNTAVTPNEINMEMTDGPYRGAVAQGVVTMDSAEQMRLIYSTGSQGRPREFRTVPGGTTATLFILKRAPTEVLYAGNWRVVDGEAGGKKLPPEQVQKTKIVLTADTLVLTDTFTNFTFVAKYRTDTAVTPNTIDMTVLEGANKGQVAHGIIAPNGADGLRLCFVMGGDDRPRDFHAAAGKAPSFCYTLHREPGPVGVQPGTIKVPNGPGPSAPSGTPAGGVPIQGGQPNNQGPPKPPGGR
jgi:uncharacterized protein (TIGR03067 family)